jgi:hypothetical protein
MRAFRVLKIRSAEVMIISKGLVQVPLAISLGSLAIEGGPRRHLEPTARGLVYALLDMPGCSLLNSDILHIAILDQIPQ